MRHNTFRIDCFPESALRCQDGFAVVAIDVIRATTTAVTASALGLRCYPAGSLEDALHIAATLDHPILAGEINGVKPAQFHMNNSPAALLELSDKTRPLVLLSSSGTRLMLNAAACDVAYLACFRNSSATADRLISENYSRIALLGAGTRGEFREEDQIGCAWIGARLMRAGYRPENEATARVLSRWTSAKATDCLVSGSVNYLRRSNQEDDLRFILERIDDLYDAFILRNGQVARIAPEVLEPKSVGTPGFYGSVPA
jgi:2-phosphosulfolactate phosphatase